MITNTDTITAIATPKGIGALAIIRISGPDSFSILDKVFIPYRGEERQHKTARLGNITDLNNSGSVLDQVVVTTFNAPNSFTGQNIAEISCHGGTFVVEKILQLLLDNGARLAGPGEFSIRAFINGKLDLVQAEAIVDVINAQTQSALNASQQQLAGNLSKHFDVLKTRLAKQLTLLELELDFSEDDIEFSDRDTLKTSLHDISKITHQFLDSYHYGHIIREGAHIVIAGAPNVGKSSILNRLLDKDRAIVSDIPGTTRDTLEESLNIKGYLFKISDTAGLRETSDIIEKQGVDRTKKLLQQADIVLYVYDLHEMSGTTPKIPDNSDKQNCILVFNKIDLYNKVEFKFNHPHVSISAKTGQGFDQMEQMIIDSVFGKGPVQFDQIITRTRHRNALVKASEHIDHALNSLQQGMSPEFISLDIRAALDYIGEITGHVTTDDILNDIFDKFCIGK